MRKIILLAFLGLPLFLQGAPEVPVAHTQEERTLVDPHPSDLTEFESQKIQLKGRVVQNLCQLTFWIGATSKMDSCRMTFLGAAAKNKKFELSTALELLFD